MRFAALDNLKYVLIILVIYGHLINLGFEVPWKVYQVIYSFHMPLFVLISGYFTNKNKSNIQYWDSTFNLAFLFILFNLISILVYTHITDTPPVQSPYIPSFALWYLLCMIYWRSIIKIIPDRILTNKAFIISIIAISVIPSTFNMNYLAFSRCLTFFPYFLLGWLLRETNIFYRLDNISGWKKFGFIALGLGCCLIATKIPINILWGHLPLDKSVPVTVIFKFASWVVAIFISLALYLLIPKKYAIKDGSNTLGYYLFHTLLLFPFLDIAKPYLPKGVMATILVLLSFIIMLHMIMKIKIIRNILTFKPYSTVKSIVSTASKISDITE